MSFQGIISSVDTEYGFRIVELVHVKDNGEDQYIFLAFEPEQYGRYKHSTQTGASVMDEAVELYRGPGRNPSLDVIHDIQSRFDIHREISDAVVRKAMGVISAFESGIDQRARTA